MHAQAPYAIPVVSDRRSQTFLGTGRAESHCHASDQGSAYPKHSRVLSATLGPALRAGLFFCMQGMRRVRRCARLFVIDFADRWAIGSHRTTLARHSEPHRKMVPVRASVFTITLCSLCDNTIDVHDVGTITPSTERDPCTSIAHDNKRLILRLID